jgi:uncharacterized membrane protein
MWAWMRYATHDSSPAFISVHYNYQIASFAVDQLICLLFLVNIEQQSR